MSQQVEYEGELAVIIGKKCKDIKAAEVEKYTKSHPSSFKLGSILCDRFFLVFSKVNLFVENGFQLKSCWNDS
jgi:hypothetical protein